MKAYKGFNKDLTCRGFQYEEGKEYVTDSASLCNSGFHACINPLDCFGYYAPGSSRYHEVEIEDNGERNTDDTKICGKKIKIGAELSVAQICKLHFVYVKSNCKPSNSNVAGDKESASAGNYGSASAGYRGSASAGNYGSASAGKCGSASAGKCGSASAGNYGSASAGKCGSASAGNYGSASAGNYGSASAGKCGSASAGNYGSAVSRGEVSVGENGSGLVRGDNIKIKGGLGAVLVLVLEDDISYDIKYTKTIKVDGIKVKADTWYTLTKNGRLQQVM